MSKADPIRPTDDEARALARDLLSGATFAALGVIDPDTGAPSVSRIAMATAPDGRPLSLISDLSAHARALKANPSASLLVGEPADRGDPLTHPRLTLQVTARETRHGEPGHAELSAHYLSQRPKAKLYAGFADFFLVTFDIEAGFLNGGFGRAFRLTAQDILG
ncbi:pyridoxamine 5-phosphate oxidase [Oceanicola sp. 22II-s10i]|uniref:HugZ family pyridoxamine 5'-phosphate oxidase n=1 Tax=Oceanicola sp. 22II-s10i TaxID=1317116 RepID=UPI000B51FC9A|nr:pyridoxamine 5'-phosphate oxidase family protein [Oceanicola sp. 22II-s10i]OWU85559.1 pyridoxamine 5-phosphate oxidase [Oceanicola sp. 22II-s10i]